MIVLLTNDDGVSSEGLLLIREYLSRFPNISKIYTFAPLKDKSAQGHAVTIGKYINYQKKGEDIYSIDGTTIDCVAFGLKYMPCRPDLVVSGINMGSNIGLDSNYSSTLAGALEASMHNIPSLALSQFYTQDKKDIAFYFDNDIFKNLLNRYLNDITLFQDFSLNVNFPNYQPEGIKVVTDNLYKTAVDVNISENCNQFVIDNAFFSYDSPELHRHPVTQGFITVTPVRGKAFSFDDDVSKMQTLF